jgi:hypothetical protein
VVTNFLQIANRGATIGDQTEGTVAHAPPHWSISAQEGKMFLDQETLWRQVDDIGITPEPDIWDARGPAFEARGLFALLGRDGNTPDGIRRLIEVPPEVEASLRAFIRLNPEEGFEIEHMLSFRQKVAEEFEYLLSQRLFDEPQTAETA